MKKTTKKKSAQKSATRTPRADRIEQNGRVHPRAGGKTAKVWGFCDALSTPKSPATRADVLAKAEKAGLNLNMASTQYGYWRTFHGIAGRVGTSAKTSAKKKPAPPARKPAPPVKKPAKPTKPARKPAKPATPVVSPETPAPTV